MDHAHAGLDDVGQHPFAPPASGLRPFQKAAASRLNKGKKTKHINAKIAPALFEAAARRVGTTSPVKVIEAALAVLAAQDDLGPWLAANWGVLADVDPEVLAEIAF